MTDIQQSRKRWHVLTILCIGLFMILLDGTIVNIAIPSIMTDFHTGFSQVEWVMNAYLLVFAVLLITMGRLGDLYGRKRLFVIGTAVFSLASLACGLAPSVNALIGFRALQGLGGAMMMPNTLSIITNVFSARERGTAMGIWGGVTGIATAVGPTLGGVLVQVASWPYIFWINVPLGIAVVVLAVRVIPESSDPTSHQQIDWAGVLVLSASLFCLTFALVEGQNYGWGSATILGLFAAAVLGLVAFVFVERTQREPLMQLSLFRSRVFSVGNICGAALTFGMMGVLFLLPIFLQSILGYSAIKTGLTLTPLAGVVIFAAPLSGWLSDRIGSRWLVSAGMLVLAGGFFLARAAMSLAADWSSFVIPFMICGIGIGMVMAPLTAVVMASAPRDKAGQASGVLSTMRQLGSVLGIAVMGAVLQNRAAVYLEQAVSTKLSAAPFIPAEAKAKIVESVGASMKNMGEMAAGGGMGRPPAAVTDMLAQVPAAMVEQVKAFFADLFSRTLMLGEFVKAMQTTFLVSMVVLVCGAALAAVFLRSHVALTEGPDEARAVDAALAVEDGAA